MAGGLRGFIRSSLFPGQDPGCGRDVPERPEAAWIVYPRLLSESAGDGLAGRWMARRK